MNSIIAALRSDQNNASFKPKGKISLVRTLLFKERSFFQGRYANPGLHFCLISIRLSLSNEGNKMRFLNIERA